MRFITTKTHGALDYLTALLLIAAPWLFDFANGEAAQWVPVIVGIAILLMAIMTNYELGLVKQIPVSTHLTIDIVMGAFLALSPWLFGFSDLIVWPHLLVGLLEIGAGLFTQREPQTTTAQVNQF